MSAPGSEGGSVGDAATGGNEVVGTVDVIRGGLVVVAGRELDVAASSVVVVGGWVVGVDSSGEVVVGANDVVVGLEGGVMVVDGVVGVGAAPVRSASTSAVRPELT